MIKFALPFWKKQETKPISVLGLRRLNTKKTRRISRKKVLFFLTIFLCFLFFLEIFFLLKNNPLQIKSINFKNADLSCVSNEQLKNFLNLTKYNLLSLNTRLLEQQSKERFICISSITIIKKIPSVIEIAADDRKQAAVIKVFQIPPLNLNLEEATSSTEAAKVVDNSKNAMIAGSFIVDFQGVIIKVDDGQSNLQTIDYYNNESELKLGSRLPNNQIKKTFQIINGLNQQSISIKTIKIIKNGLFLSGESEYIFSLSKDIDHQLISLQLIIQKNTMESKSAQKIDLRFDKAIVVYSGK